MTTIFGSRLPNENKNWIRTGNCKKTLHVKLKTTVEEMTLILQSIRQVLK